MTIEKQIGGGFDGVVLGTSQKTAIKSLNNKELYRQERDVYLYLREKEIWQVNDFHIPQLIGSDDELSVIEMTLVSPPFLFRLCGREPHRKNSIRPGDMAGMEGRKERAVRIELA